MVQGLGPKTSGFRVEGFKVRSRCISEKGCNSRKIMNEQACSDLAATNLKTRKP